MFIYKLLKKTKVKLDSNKSIMSNENIKDKFANKNNPEEKNINEIFLKKFNLTLETVIEINKDLSNYKDILNKQKNTSFTSKYIPSITLIKYLERIMRYTEAEESTFLIALIYIDRIGKISNVILTPFNVHKLIFVSVLLAIKYNEDTIYNFNYYSLVSGISINELQQLEIDFLILLKFKLYINKNEFSNYKLLFDNVDNDDEDGIFE